MSKEWSGQMPEVEKEKNNELTIDEKKQIGDFWPEMILGNGIVVENIEKMKDDEVADWMYETLNDEVDDLMKELDIEVSEELIGKISSEQDAETKANLQMEYIEDCQKKMFVVFGRARRVSSRWSSWPKSMRDNGNSNCVGATLLGINALERAGIENYCGNPIGHVVNIVKLSNGNWVYVDFLNNHVRKINPSINSIENVDLLDIRDEAIKYEVVPISDKKKIIGLILGNLPAMEHEINEVAIPDDDFDKLSAIKYYNEFREQFSKINFKTIRDKVFRDEMILRSSKIMQDESMRLDRSRGFDQREIKNFFLNVTQEQRSNLMREIQENLVGMRNLLLNDDEAILQNVSELLVKLIKIYQKALKRIKENDRELYDEIVKRELSKGEK